jgi:hypothetical protein
MPVTFRDVLDARDRAARKLKNLFPDDRAVEVLYREFGSLLDVSNIEDYARLYDIFNQLAGPYGHALWKAHLVKKE